MAKSTNYYQARSESDFPTTLPSYGVWWDKKTFSLHKTLTAAKNAISARATNNMEVNGSYYYNRGNRPTVVTFTQDVKVYELHGTSWTAIYTMKKDAPRDEHELWKAPAPKHKISVSDDEVEDAIASILGNRS